MLRVIRHLASCLGVAITVAACGSNSLKASGLAASSPGPGGNEAGASSGGLPESGASSGSLPESGVSGSSGGTSSNPPPTPSADASTPDGLVQSGSDSGLPTQPGDAAILVADAGPLAPKFQTTTCIDPSAVTADTEYNFPCNGIEFWVVVPQQCFTRTCGLIFNIHGGAMNDHTTMEQATNMIAIGSKSNFIVVHPHNPSGTWNIPNDKQTVFDAMQQIIQAFDVDREHVHSTGYSQGARISWALACEHADVVASIAPAEENNTDSDCWKTAKLPVRQVSVLFQFGMQDQIAGGFSTAQTTVDEFVAADMLGMPQTIGGSTGTNWLRQRWTNSSGNVLEFISHNYTNPLIAGHCLVNPMGTTFVNCSTPVDYDWGEEAVAFFVAHPLH